jgi:hypothetical protein
MNIRVTLDIPIIVVVYSTSIVYCACYSSLSTLESLDPALCIR